MKPIFLLMAAFFGLGLGISTPPVTAIVEVRTTEVPLRKVLEMIKRTSVIVDQNGTGVCIGHSKEGSYILTAKHVTDNSEDHFIVAWGEAGRYTTLEAKLIADSGDYDLALLHVKAFLPNLKMSPLNAPVRGLVIVGGVSYYNWRGRLPVATVVGTVTSYEAQQMEYSATVSPGYSGGPVVDYYSGELVGITQMMFISQADRSLGCPVETIIAWLSRLPK
jgi:S1-C subfamily serine protease